MNRPHGSAELCSRKPLDQRPDGIRERDPGSIVTFLTGFQRLSVRLGNRRGYVRALPGWNRPASRRGLHKLLVGGACAEERGSNDPGAYSLRDRLTVEEAAQSERSAAAVDPWHLL